MSAATVVVSSATVPPEPYPHLVRLVPCLSVTAPASLQAWVTITGAGPDEVVILHLYQCDALPPPPSYVPASPLTHDKKPAIDETNPDGTTLPDPVALIATLVFTSASTIRDPTLGPAAHALPPATSTPPQEAEDMRTYRVQKVYEWMGYQASWAGCQLPWAPVEADVPEESEAERLRKQNEELKEDNACLCCLVVFC